MVWQQGHGHGLACSLQAAGSLGVESLEDGLEQAAVERPDGVQLEGDIAVVPGLIAGFHVHIHQVIGLQSVDGGLCLALVVGVPQARGTRHIYDAQPCITADAAYEVHCRYHGSALDLRESLRERCHHGAVTSSPGPDAVGWVLPLRHAPKVEGMGGKQPPALLHQVQYEPGSVLGSLISCLGQILAPGFAGNVMGRCAQEVLVALMTSRWRSCTPV